MNNYYLDEKFLKYRQNDFLAQAQHERLARHLKQVAAESLKASNQAKGNKPKFNWLFGPKHHSAAGLN